MLYTPPEGTDYCHPASPPLPRGLVSVAVRYGYIEGDIGSSGGSNRDAEPVVSNRHCS